MLRSTTILDLTGDTTVAWNEESDEQMTAIIKKAMERGVTFFILEAMPDGTYQRGERLWEADEAAKHRALTIPDADFSRMVGEGKAIAVKTPAAPRRSTKVSRDPSEVARSQSIGVQPRAGG